MHFLLQIPRTGGYFTRLFMSASFENPPGNHPHRIKILFKIVSIWNKNTPNLETKENQNKDLFSSETFANTAFQNSNPMQNL